MTTSYIVSKEDRAAHSSKIETSVTSKILAVYDLNDDKMHYGIVGDTDRSVSLPAHTISVKTKNGERTSRCFDDKLEKAGLEKGDAFVAEFVERNGYANLSTITKK